MLISSHEHQAEPGAAGACLSGPVWVEPVRTGPAPVIADRVWQPPAVAEVAEKRFEPIPALPPVPSLDDLTELIRARSQRPGILHLLCPAGIGDFAWIWSKLHAVARNRPVRVWFPQGEQQRAGGYAALLGLECGYLEGVTSGWVWDRPGDPELPASGQEDNEEDNGAVSDDGESRCVVVHANHHLEAGRRIEEWYPALPFVAPVPDLAKYSARNNEGLPREEFWGNEPYCLAFLCHEGYMEGNLAPALWGKLLQRVHEEVAPVRLIGAGRDVPFARAVLEYYRQPQGHLFDRPIGEVLAASLGARLCWGVAGGPLIAATYMGARTYMAYPRWLYRMPGSWEQPGARTGNCFVKDLDDRVLTGDVSRIAGELG